MRAAGAPAQSGGPVRLALAILCTLGLLARVASQCVNMKKDPHLAFARGGRADFRGRNGAYYAFLSTPGLQVNVRTEEATFKSYRDALTIDGSFITEVHVLALVGGEKHKLATASFWTSELNEFTTGPNMINGTCGDRGQFFLGTGGHKKCEELEVAIKFSSARFMLPGWTFKVAANRVWGHISGPVHRLDVSLHAHGDEAALHQTHGLVGQSFAWRSARDGKRDSYPSEGRFRTSAMGEGAIEGDATMYELAGPLATEFPFSRFREAKKPMLLPLPAGAATVDASSADQVEVAGAASAPPDRVSARLLVQRRVHQTAWVLRKRGLRECLSRPQRVPLGVLPSIRTRFGSSGSASSFRARRPG